LRLILRSGGSIATNDARRAWAISSSLNNAHRLRYDPLRPAQSLEQFPILFGVIAWQEQAARATRPIRHGLDLTLPSRRPCLGGPDGAPVGTDRPLGDAQDARGVTNGQDR
jgi:hypothetical protein